MQEKLEKAILILAGNLNSGRIYLSYYSFAVFQRAVLEVFSLKRLSMHTV